MGQPVELRINVGVSAGVIELLQEMQRLTHKRNLQILQFA